MPLQLLPCSLNGSRGLPPVRNYNSQFLLPCPRRNFLDTIPPFLPNFPCLRRPLSLLPLPLPFPSSSTYLDVLLSPSCPTSLHSSLGSVSAAAGSLLLRSALTCPPLLRGNYPYWPVLPRTRRRGEAR